MLKFNPSAKLSEQIPILVDPDLALTDGVGEYPRKADLQRDIDKKYNISPEIQFLVLRTLESKIETLCIAKRRKTNRHGSELTQIHWGYFDDGKYTSPRLPTTTYVRLIHESDIVECIQKFEHLQDAKDYFEEIKQQSISSVHRSTNTP